MSPGTLHGQRSLDAVYAVGVTFLAAPWFWWRRRHGPVQVAA